MSEQLEQDVTRIVQNLLKNNEEAEMRKEIEDALKKSSDKINELNSSLEAKEQELSDLNEVIVKHEEHAATLKIELEEALKAKEVFESEKAGFSVEKDELIKKLDEASAALDDIKKEQLVVARMADLEAAGVLSTDKDAQSLRVKEMTDETFNSYKTELVSIKDSIMATIESANVNNDKYIVSVNTASVASASVNFEAAPSKGILARYDELGKAMAASITKDTKGIKGK